MAAYGQQQDILIVQKYSSTEQRSLRLLHLKDKLSRMCTELARNSDSSVQNLAAKETYVLSRLIRQLDNAFRRHKHFQLAKKILKLASLVVRSDFPAVLVDLHTSIQLSSSNDGSCYCFNAEYFDHFLNRWSVLQGLLRKIEIYCENCYVSLSHFMNTGHFAVQCCIFVGCIAAIRKKSRTLRSKLVEMYKNLRSDDAIFTALKSNNPKYIRSDVYLDEQLHETVVDMIPNFADVKEYMSVFECLLSDFNSSTDFKVGLNQVLIDKQKTTAVNSTKDVQNIGSASKVDFGVRIDRRPDITPLSSVQTLKSRGESDIVSSVRNWKTLQDVKKVYIELKNRSSKKPTYFKHFKSMYAAALKQRKSGKSRQEIAEIVHSMQNTLLNHLFDEVKQPK